MPDNLLSGFDPGGRPTDEKRFLEVFMDQNNLCNLRCVMCAFSDPRVEKIGRHRMPIELFERIASEVFPHARYLTLSCLTEPLMNRDLPRRLEITAGHDVPFVEMVTNGQLLTEALVDAMIDHRLTRLGVSLDGATAPTYEAIRQGGSFDRLIDRLEMFRRRRAGRTGPVLRLDLVLSETNVGEFDQFLELAERFEAGAVDVRTVVPFRGAPEQGSRADSFWDQIRSCREKLAAFVERTGIEDIGYLRDRPDEIVLYDGETKRICRRPWTTAAIHWNGDVMICSTWQRSPVGSLAEQSFSEIWNGPQLAAIRSEFESRQPGLDCLYCQIKKEDPDEEEDGFFQMLAKSPAKTRLDKQC